MSSEEKTHLIVSKFYDDVKEKQQSCEKWAGYYKGSHLFVTVYVITVGLAITVLSGLGMSTIAIMILGTSIAGMKTLSSVFTFEEKGVKLKLASVRLRRLLRDVYSESVHFDEAKMKELQVEFDDLDLMIFDGGSATVNDPTVYQDQNKNLV